MDIQAGCILTYIIISCCNVPCTDDDAAEAAVNSGKLSVTHTCQIPVRIIKECVMQPKVLKNKVPRGSEYMFSNFSCRCNNNHSTFSTC